MSKIGIFLLGGFVLILMSRATKPGFAAIYTAMNNTITLAPAESMLWRAMPILIPIVLWGILVFVVSGKIGIGEEEF